MAPRPVSPPVPAGDLEAKPGKARGDLAPPTLGFYKQIMPTGTIKLFNGVTYTYYVIHTIISGKMYAPRYA